MEIQPSSSAPLSSPREVRIPIDDQVDPVQREIIEEFNLAETHIYDLYWGPVDPVRTFIDDFINQRKLLKSECLELHTAAVNGDIEKVKVLIQKKEIQLQGNDKFRLMLCHPITESDETVLHVAAGAKHTHFVAKMLKYIQPEDLEREDNNRNNPFCFAAMAGAKEIIKKMLHMNSGLLTIPNGENMTPLYLAVIYGQRDTATFLFENYDGSPMEDIIDLFFESLSSNFYDLALSLLRLDNRRNELAVTRYEKPNEKHGTALHMLARNPLAFDGNGNNLTNHQMGLSTQAVHELLRSLWDDIKCIKEENFGAYMEANKDFLFAAAKLGNSNFLAELIKFYPDLVRMRDKKDRTIFHIALLHRHVTLFNLMNNIGFNKHFVAALEDKCGNNLLHLAATYDPRPPVSMMPGAALRMQQELKTFEEVALLVRPSLREKKNKKGLTPRELFTKDHKDLLEEGEAWMRKTSESCMLVATIITTVVFSATSNVPGGYNDDGIPIFWKNFIFCGFTIADAVTLSSSSLSILIFLSALTSRYEEENFRKSLPLKLWFGIITLFISISTMMLSFSLSIFLAYDKAKISYKIIPISVSMFVIGPAIAFVFLQLRLLKDIFVSTFRPRFSLMPIDY